MTLFLLQILSVPDSHFINLLEQRFISKLLKQRIIISTFPNPYHLIYTNHFSNLTSWEEYPWFILTTETIAHSMTRH